MTDRTFWGPNCPIPIRPFVAIIWNLGPYHLLDIITKEQSAKFQIKWTTASIVMRPRNFSAPKRVSPKKWAKIGPKLVFPVFQVEIHQKSWVQTKFEAERLKIAPFMIDRTFWDPNCPIPIGLLRGKIRSLRHYHLLDIVTKEKPWKFQIKQTAVSIVMIPRNFCAPKRVSTRKGPQMLPICNFLIFQVEIPWNYVYSPNLKRNGWKLLHLWPTALSGTQNCPIPIGLLRGKIRSLGHYHLLHIVTKEKPCKLQNK